MTELSQAIMERLAGIAFDTLRCKFNCEFNDAEQCGKKRDELACPCECHNFWAWMIQFWAQP